MFRIICTQDFFSIFDISLLVTLMEKVPSKFRWYFQTDMSGMKPVTVYHTVGAFRITISMQDFFVVFFRLNGRPYPGLNSKVHWANIGPIWVRCWPHEPCYRGTDSLPEFCTLWVLLVPLCNSINSTISDQNLTYNVWSQYLIQW